MRIVLSADCFYPAQMGGPSNAIYWQAKALTRVGHDITIVATSQDLPPEIELDAWLTLDCGRVIYTKNPHFYLPVKQIWYGWKVIRKADVVHINSLFYPASLMWALLSRLMGKPVVWSPHGELSPEALGYGSGMKRWLLKIIKRLSSVICFHATCDAEASHIRGQFGQDVPIVSVRNMMELPTLMTPSSTSHPYLLFIGRLHPIKAIDRLLDALSTSTVFRKSNYSLRIAGPDFGRVYAQQLRQQVKKLNLTAKVLFIGSVDGVAKEQLYANAYVTILPSHSENFGNVVIESLAQGTPVIASTGAPWQLLETEQVGLWTSNDPANLRQAIETFLTMPKETYLGYRQRAIELVQRDYNIMTNVAIWEQVYERVVMRNELKK
ncbi:glycosyltransferase family 4 protein [Spirosoma validum]|uniref:Glycosyltransferase family 4 protein n=1 Tax=Spirosoma validum TaxID=2771355 RepID=A0A927GBG4_9BACT|nr:glycosyltransferase family 4 protein [Spirosoma validum]MBD2751376.1 glycosyltransferase family 4 protein [Spirosoma validum]